MILHCWIEFYYDFINKSELVYRFWYSISATILTLNGKASLFWCEIVQDCINYGMPFEKNIRASGFFLSLRHSTVCNLPVSMKFFLFFFLFSLSCWSQANDFSVRHKELIWENVIITNETGIPERAEKQLSGVARIHAKWFQLRFWDWNRRGQIQGNRLQYSVPYCERKRNRRGEIFPKQRCIEKWRGH